MPTVAQVADCPLLRLSMANEHGVFPDGPHLHMSIEGYTTHCSFLSSAEIAKKFDDFRQADLAGYGSTVVSKDLLLFHCSTHTLRDPVKQRFFAPQLRRQSTFIATCPESRFKQTDTQLLHGYIVVSSACTKA